MLTLTDPSWTTPAFIVLLMLLVLASARRVRTGTFFPSATTRELKGLAILGVVLSHVGYFLVDDHRFLFPLTIFAGISVDLFLFLSGYGLTLTTLAKHETRRQFYTKRIPALMLPFWLTTGALVLVDYLMRGTTYPLPTLLSTLFGVVTTANIYTDLNAPLWYLTWLLFHYVLFSLCFSPKRPWASALGVLAGAWCVIMLRPAPLAGVIGLYLVHGIAFPLGMLAAWLRTRPSLATSRISTAWSALAHGAGVRHTFLHYGTLSLLVLGICYSALRSGVGHGPFLEQLSTLFTAALIVLLFTLKRTEFRLLSLFGVYSYELYLFHWPLLYRYGILYAHLPAWIATLLYLMLFLALGWAVYLVADRISRALRFSQPSPHRAL